MGDNGFAPDGEYRRRLLGTTRRRVAAGALGAIVVLVAVTAGLLMQSGSPAPAHTARTAPAARTSAGNMDFLNDVSCVSRSFCVAVGYYQPNSDTRPLIESWDGARWSITPSPNPGTYDQLYGVSCASLRLCVAVGYYHAGNDRNRTLIESWDGVRWSIAASPNTSVNDGNILTSVSCTSGSFCTAVGHYRHIAVNRTKVLIESWDGTRWSIAANPSMPVNEGASLTRVSCTSSSACTAVGSYFSGSTLLVESWDGARWSIAPTPGVPADAVAYAVSCADSNLCVVTGYHLIRSARRPPQPSPWVESWDGARWSIDAIPPVKGTALIYGVSCAGKSNCVATGWYSHAGSAAHTLVESWDGARWSTAASPTTSANDGLFGVSCVPGFCAAAGYSSSTSHTHTLIESWDGARWSIAASPNE
jgi:hypothetical protein